MSFYQPEITLIEKNEVSVTPVDVKGDSTLGNLTKYRLSAEYRDTINDITKNGQITLRSPFGLFDLQGPVLTDEDTKENYLIQVMLRQGTDEGQLFRFEISSINNNDSVKGKHITLNLTSYDIRIEEFYDSENLRLVTPNFAFGRRIRRFLAGRDLTSTGSIKLTYTASQNLLPDDERLKQDWLPTEPTTTKELLSEVIRRVSSPHEVSSTNEDWYYNIVPQADTESFRIFVDRMGEVESNVIIDVKSEGVRVMTNDINAYFDNKKYKNGLIVKGKKASHSVPMEFTRLASDFTHASLASIWSLNTDYLKGDYAKSGNNYYKCKQDNTADASNAPDVSSVYWNNLSTTTLGSPWTASVDLWKANIIGSESPPAGYVGFFNDMNIVRKQYDRDDEFDEFEVLSVKDVEDFLTTPADIPTGQIEHGRRWLINGSSIGTVWAGHNAQIAQYDESVSPAVWRFSNDPITGDIVNMLENCTTLRFDGSIWQVIWSLNTNPQTSSPFFPIESITKISNRHGLQKAIEFRFDWNVFDVASITEDILNIIEYIGPASAKLKLLTWDLSTFVANTIAGLREFLGITDDTEINDAFGVGNSRNKASRRYGFTLKFPFPRRAVTNHGIGSEIKKHTVDFFNLNESMISGKVGWNEGLDSEDLGNIRAVRYWVKLLHENHADQEINGIANTPMIFWYRDLFDRIALHRFTIPIHNAWQKITIPAGPDSKLEIFDSRIDELFSAAGYIFPFNHFIKERELTGVKFDWTKVIEMGCINEESYDDNLLYNAGQNSYISIITEHALQLVKNLAVYTGEFIDMEKVVTDHVKFSIDDLHFVKDAYVTTSDTKLASPRIKKINAANQFDYVNLKNNIGQRKLSRLQYHPELHTIYSRGTVKLFPGQLFTLRGQYGSEKKLVATQIDHIEDSTGYHCRIKAIRKYEP